MERSSRLGFAGTFCIHPVQVDIANRCFSPPVSAVDRVRRLLAVFDAEVAMRRGACAFEGSTDEPVARRARQLVERSEQIERLARQKGQKKDIFWLPGRRNGCAVTANDACTSVTL